MPPATGDPARGGCGIARRPGPGRGFFQGHGGVEILWGRDKWDKNTWNWVIYHDIYIYICIYIYISWVLINCGDKEIHATMLPITVGNSFSQSTESKGRIPLHQRFNSHTGISVPWSLHNLVIWRQAAPPNNLPVKCGGGTPTKALTGQEFSRLKNMKAIAANGCAKMIQNVPNHNYSSLPMARPSLPWSLWPFV